MKKKWIWAVLVLSLFSGCGQQGNNPVNADETYESLRVRGEDSGKKNDYDEETGTSSKEAESEVNTTEELSEETTEDATRAEELDDEPLFSGRESVNEGVDRLIFSDDLEQLTWYLSADEYDYYACTWKGSGGLLIVESDRAVGFLPLTDGSLSKNGKNADGSDRILFSSYEADDYVIRGTGAVIQNQRNGEAACIGTGDGNYLTMDWEQEGVLFLYDETDSLIWESRFEDFYRIEMLKKTDTSYFVTLFSVDETRTYEIDKKNGKSAAIGEANGVSYTLTDGNLLLGTSQNRSRVYLYDIQTTEERFVPISNRNYLTLHAASDGYFLCDDLDHVMLFNYEGELLYVQSFDDYGCYVMGGREKDGKFRYCVDSGGFGITDCYEIDPEKLTVMDREQTLGFVDYPDGITIVTGEDVIQPFWDYQVTYCTDSETNLLLEETIQSFTDGFPENFWEELLSEESDYDSIVYSFVESIYGIDDESLTQAGGLCTTEGNTIYIWISQDITGEYMSTLAHETLHAMENSMTSRGDYFSDWDAYLPEDFSYSYSYVEEDRWDYTPLTGEEDVYFGYSYQLTYPTEDRAVLFEFLYTDNPYYQQFPQIVERINYLNQVLCENFPSLEEAFWNR